MLRTRYGTQGLRQNDKAHGPVRTQTQRKQLQSFLMHGLNTGMDILGDEAPCKWEVQSKAQSGTRYDSRQHS